MGYNRHAGALSLLGVHFLGPLVSHVGSLLFGAHLGHILFAWGPFGVHSILGHMGPILALAAIPFLEAIVSLQCTRCTSLHHFFHLSQRVMEFQLAAEFTQ